MLIYEPEANFNNMLIDVMLANLTTHFETISNGASCETGKRRLPNFMLRQRRVQRSIFGRMFKKVLKKSGKFIGWTAALTTAGTIGSNTAVWLDHHLARDDYIFTQQQEFSCNSFNYGCYSHLCWANCGARRDSADWCFTKTSSANSTQTTPFGIVHNAKLCNYNKDCDPCSNCASECFRDSEIY